MWNLHLFGTRGTRLAWQRANRSANESISCLDILNRSDCVGCCIDPGLFEAIQYAVSVLQKQYFERHAQGLEKIKVFWLANQYGGEYGHGGGQPANSRRDTCHAGTIWRKNQKNGSIPARQEAIFVKSQKISSWLRNHSSDSMASSLQVEYERGIAHNICK